MRIRAANCLKRATDVTPLLVQDDIEDDYGSDSGSDCSSFQFTSWKHGNDTKTKQGIRPNIAGRKLKSVIKVKSTPSRRPLLTRQEYLNSSALNVSTSIPHATSLESDGSTNNQSYQSSRSQSSVKVIYSEHWKEKNNTVKSMHVSKKSNSSKAPTSHSLPMFSISFKTCNHNKEQESNLLLSPVYGSLSDSSYQIGSQENENINYHNHIVEAVALKLKETKSPRRKMKSKKSSKEAKHSMRNNTTSHIEGRTFDKYKSQQMVEKVEVVTQKLLRVPESKRDIQYMQGLLRDHRKSSLSSSSKSPSKNNENNPFKQEALKGSARLDRDVASISEGRNSKSKSLSTKKESKKQSTPEDCVREDRDAASISDGREHMISPQKIGRGASSIQDKQGNNDNDTQSNSLGVWPTHNGSRSESTQNGLNKKEISSGYLDASENTFISICLLNLSESEQKPSTKLKHCLAISGRQNFDCEVTETSVVLEEIFRSQEEQDKSVLAKLWRAQVILEDLECGQRCQKVTSFQSNDEDEKTKLITLLKNGDNDKALEFLIDITNSYKHQTNIASWINVGSIQLLHGRYSEAVTSFERATGDMEENTSREARRLALLGMALYGDERFEDANQAYLRALTMLRTKRQGYGCYNQKHEFWMGQIFNAVGCSFFETGFHKSASRSFLNALQIYLQDIFDGSLKAQESLSLEFLLNKVKQNMDQMTSMNQKFIHDIAVTFSNLAQVLIKQQSLDLAVSYLRVALKLHMSANNDAADGHTMVAVLFVLGHTYLNQQKVNDAQKVFELILRTGREKFKTARKVYHETMFKSAIVMQKLKLMEQDLDASVNYAGLAKYHRHAAIDLVKIKNIHDEYLTTSEEDEDKREEEESSNYGRESHLDSLSLLSSSSNKHRE